MNRQITDSQVRVIGPDGKQCGVMAIADALDFARGFGMDLVEIAPSGTPPIVRVVNYVKFQEEMKGRAKRRTPHDYTNN